MTPRRWARGGLLAGAVLVAGAAAAQAPPPQIPKSLDIPDGALIAAGRAPELDILFTGDVIGYLEDCGCKMNPAGGLARRAWVLKQLQANYPSTPVVLLDSGNFSDNPTETGDERTEALLQAMKRLGYRAVNVGERDLEMGYEDFKKRIEGLPIAFISSNMVTQGTKDPVFTPYTTFEIKGTSGAPVRIGVLGVDRYSPIWQKAGPPGTNIAVVPAAGMIAKYLPEVRAKSDVVVLLASVSQIDAHDLAKQFPDIDLILGTYGGVVSNAEETEGRVRIYYTGNQGKRMGESRLTLDAKRRVSDVDTYLHFLTAHYPEDKAMQDSIAAVVAKTKKPPEPKKELPANPQAVPAKSPGGR